MLQCIVAGRARVANLLLECAFFLRHLRKLRIINLLRDGIVDKFLNERVLAGADGNEKIGIVGLGIRLQAILFFQLLFGGVHDQIQHLIVKVNLLQLLADSFFNILFTSVALRALVRSFGLGAAVVGMTFLDFRRHLQTTLPADEETAVGKDLVSLSRFRMLRRVEELVDLFKQRTRNDRLMRSRVKLSLPQKHARVHRIGQDTVDGAFPDFLVVSRTKAILKQFVRNTHGRPLSRSVQVENSTNEWSKRRVWNYPHGFVFAGVAERGSSRIFTAPHAFIHAALHIPTQVPDVLIGHRKLNARDYHIVIRVVVPVKRLDLLNHAILQ